MIRFAVDAITSFSAAPLRLSLYFSLWSVLLAFLVGLYAIWKWASGETVPGWTSITVILLVFGGMQMFCIGIIGEYVGRIYTQSKQRPLFVIRSIQQNRTGGAVNRRRPWSSFQQVASGPHFRNVTIRKGNFQSSLETRTVCARKTRYLG